MLQSSILVVSNCQIIQQSRISSCSLGLPQSTGVHQYEIRSNELRTCLTQIRTKFESRKCSSITRVCIYVRSVVQARIPYYLIASSTHLYVFYTQFSHFSVTNELMGPGHKSFRILDHVRACIYTSSAVYKYISARNSVEEYISVGHTM